jgi:sulfite exporter TauE/SafE
MLAMHASTHIGNPTQITVLSAILLGLIASISTCVVLTSALLISLTSTSSKPVQTSYAFVIGRILGYTLFGAVLGFLGQTLKISVPVHMTLTVLISLLLVYLGISSLTKFSFFSSTKLETFLKKVKATSPIGSAVVGSLTFFLPCGFTQMVQLYALSLATPVQGALLLGAFALGSAPALLGLGSVQRLVPQKIKQFVKDSIAFLMIFFAIYSVAGLLMFVSPIDTQAKVADQTDNLQVIHMDIKGYSYNPAAFEVKKGIPVRWEIDATLAQGCAFSLVAAGINVQESLKAGLNIITFTPQKTGSYVFSCSMGMAGPGKLVVVE